MTTHYDPYEVLNLQRNSTPHEIRNAFIKLAKTHHPDVTGGSKERFQKIQNAYNEIKRDWKKNRSSVRQDFTPDDSTPWRGSDISITLNLSLEDVAHGCRKKIIYKRLLQCGVCRPQPDPSCRICLGTGVIYFTRPMPVSPDPQACPRCRKPEEAIKQCPECGGKEMINYKTDITILTPKGLTDGCVLKLPGQGDYPPPPFHLPGNLLIFIKIKEHALFKQVGRDLHLLWDVSIGLSGAFPVIPTLYGIEELVRKPRPGDVVRLKEKGLPEMNSTMRGDLLVYF